MFLIVELEQLYYIPLFSATTPTFSLIKNVIIHRKPENKIENNTPKRVEETELEVTQVWF